MRGSLRLALALVALAGASGCRAPAARGGATGSAADLEVLDDATGLTGSHGPVARRSVVPEPEVVVADVPAAEVVAGVYATDERFVALADGWEARVRAAVDRVELATGLSFRDRAAPRVILTPLEAERPAWRADREVAQGRRRLVVRVNARPLMVGREDVDDVLAHALAEAAIDPARTDAAAPPRWFALYVGHLAAGDVADRIDRLTRAAARGGPPLRIDPADEARAEATAIGAALLLAERSTPPDVRRLVALVADGDDPDRLLPRAVGLGGDPWTGSAREILEDAASRVDLEADRVVDRFRRTLAELGPAGLEDALAEAVGTITPTDRIRAEVEALRLAGALATGDVEAGRAVVARAPTTARFLALLDEPAAYVLDAARLESLEGGDAARAWVLLSRFDRDFPTHPSRARAFEEIERLLPRVPPEIEPTVLARVLSERGASGLAPATVVRRVRALLVDHRIGAARRFLSDVGTRADEDEAVVALRAEVLAAEAEPSIEARDRNRARVAAWAAAPSSATEADVVDGGAAAADALADRLPAAGEERAKAVRLVLRAAGLARAISLLSTEWNGAIARFAPDVAVLASETGYADLRRTIEAMFPAVRTDARAAAEWERVCLGLDPIRLAADDALLSRLHSPEFTLRRAAFEEVVEGASPVRTPALLSHFAHDPSVLLRRLAVRAAGRAGLAPIAQDALSDGSWVVRQAACAALVDASGADAAPLIVPLLSRPDPDERVQEAAANALVKIAAKDRAWVRLVVSMVRVGDARVADGVAAALPDLPPASVARALAAELWVEAVPDGARGAPAVLSRLFHAYGIASGTRPGYELDMTKDAARDLVRALPENRGGPRADAPAR